MLIAWKLKTLLLAFCVVIAAMPTTGAARPFAVNATAPEPFSDDQNQKTAKDDSKADSEEEAEDESAPAALEIDVSNSSPLIRELYQATRETKEKDLARSGYAQSGQWCSAQGSPSSLIRMTLTQGIYPR